MPMRDMAESLRICLCSRPSAFVRCIAVTGSLRMVALACQIHRDPSAPSMACAARMMSPGKSRKPISPSRAFDVGRSMQWMLMFLPGFVMRSISARMKA